MKSDTLSTDAVEQVDFVVSNAGIPNLAPLTSRHKHHHPAAARAGAMLAFAAGLLVAALGAWAADEPARPRPTAERAGTDIVRFQPTAERFAFLKSPRFEVRC